MLKMIRNKIVSERTVNQSIEPKRRLLRPWQMACQVKSALLNL